MARRTDQGLKKKWNVEDFNTNRCFHPGKPKREWQHPVCTKVQPRSKQEAGVYVQVSEGKGVNPQLCRRSPFPLAGPPLGHFMAVANRPGAICFPTLVGSHRSFHWLECQLLLRPEMHPEVYGTSGIYLKGQSSPLWTVSCSSQEFRHSFFIHTIHPLL